MSLKVKRPREIKSCQKCFKGKRKCDKAKPSCGRCKKLDVACYYTPSSLHTKFISTSIHSSTSKQKSYFELEPIDDTPSFIKRFKIFLDPSGIQSIYFPIAFFPFNDSASNRCIVLNRSPDVNDKKIMFDFSTWIPQKLDLAHIKAKIPCKTICDLLVTHFFSSVFPLIPILDKESFLIDYKSFWSDSLSFHNLNGLVLIHAILFCASCSLQINDHFFKKRSETDYESIMLDSYCCIENGNHLLNIENIPSIPSLTALTLIYYVSSMNCYGLAAKISLLLRYSQLAGLHKKISKASGTTLKDILFEYIVLLDSLVSYYYGLSPQAHENQDESFLGINHSVLMTYSLIKFKCGRLWSLIIRELDKANELDEICLFKFCSTFASVQAEVNALNNSILANSDKSYFNIWLVTEGRLCLRRAALLLNFSLTQSAQHENDNTNDHELIIESLLLINESFMKVHIALEYHIDCFWFIRTSYPFESLNIVIKNLRERPDDLINFAAINSAINYTRCPMIDYIHGDLRKKLLPPTFDVLEKIQNIWPLSFRKAFSHIVEVYQSVSEIL